MLKLPAAIAEPRRPFVTIVIGWLLACPPSLLLSALINSWMPGVEQPSFGTVGPGTVALLVIFSPLIETLIMAAVIEVLLRFTPPLVAIAISSIGWGFAHSMAAPVWGLVIWWPFLVFSTIYVIWRERSAWAAIGIVFCVHALQNLGPALFLLKEATA